MANVWWIVRCWGHSSTALRVAAVAALLTVVAAPSPPARGSDDVPEQTSSDEATRIKVAVLYKIGKFVHWPAEMAAREEFSFCVFGDDTYGPELDRLNGMKVNGKPVKVQRLDALGDIPCHVLLFGKMDDASQASALRSLHGESTLTIGEQVGFARNGGILGLHVVEQKLVIEVNVEAAQRADLEFSSNFLKLAKIVSPGT